MIPVAVAGLSPWSPQRTEVKELTPGLIHALRNEVPEGAIVFSDDTTSYRIAAWAPVYVANALPGHVADTKPNRPYERREDSRRFFRTGDLGFVDPEGFLHFTGRLKDVIKTAGVNVAASEVEGVLLRHPAVQAAHVVGVRHPTRGENVAAFVVLRASGGVTPDEIQGFCRECLASYKVPRHVFVVAEVDLPRTASGKVEKVALQRLAETLQARRRW